MIVSRWHEFSAAHRIVGHGGKCERLHGHNYMVRFDIEGPVNRLGMVVDFDDIKKTLCEWIDKNWDHRTIIWDEDPLANEIVDTVNKFTSIGSVELVPFNTTAENMAIYLMGVGRNFFPERAVQNCRLRGVVIEETNRCSVKMGAHNE